jgi:hypothetical protein
VLPGLQDAPDARVDDPINHEGETCGRFSLTHNTPSRAGSHSPRRLRGTVQCREPTTAGGTNTIKTDTLRQLVREGKLSKAVQLARMKYDAEERELPAMATPTRDHIARTVRDEFPVKAAANAVPTQEQLLRMHRRSMAIIWRATTQRSSRCSATASEPSQPDCGQRLSGTCWRA